MDFEAELEACDFVGVIVGDEPVVGVASVITGEHDALEVVDAGRILHGFAGADEFGDAVGIESFEAGDGGLGYFEAGRIDAEVVAAVDFAGEAIHEDVIAVLGNDVEDDAPILTGHEGIPHAVGDDGMVVAGPVAGGDEGAAIAGSHWTAADFVLLLVEPRDVVLRSFEECVEGDDVPEIDVADAVSVQAVGDALEFLPILWLDVRPVDVLRRIAEELPTASGTVGVVEAGDAEGLLDLRGEEVAMLESDLVGRSVEMDVDPVRTLETIGALRSVLARLART